MHHTIPFNPKTGQVIVIGASAGGLKALSDLMIQFPENFPSPVLIVQHISADASGDILLDAINKNKNLKCVHAADGELVKAGHVYLAPPDHHLMIKRTAHLMVTKGAMENRYRPAIDPLFRSVAISFGNRAIGIVLTGYLDDGTAGLIAIQRCGGTCIIQDPKDADYPDMPQNALNQIEPDFCVAIPEMGGLLSTLLERKFSKQKLIPKDIQLEAKIAERVLSDLSAVNALGDQVPFNCPGCGGVLWRINKGPVVRYRCHTGHAYTAKALISEQTIKIEETMWIALRMFEERRNLLTTFAKDQTGAAARFSLERAEESLIHIKRIKSILLANDEYNESNQPS